jgi:signal transduction histidine kinase
MRAPLDSAFEAAFRADYATSSLSSVRFGLLLGAVLYSLFAPLDLWMLPLSWRAASLIRFAVVLPVCLIALALSFLHPFRRHLQLLVSVFVVVGGFGIVAMIALAQDSEPGFRYYYAGLLLVLTYSFTVVRLRFRPTAVCCLAIIGSYELVAVLDQRLLSDGILQGWGPVFLNNNFFLIAAGVITLIGAYILEDYSRKDFRQRNELAKTLDELKATQTELIQIERTTAMGHVVAGLLHELNSPVGAIGSAVDVMNRGSQQLKSLEGYAQGRRAEKWESTLSLIEENALVLRNATQRVKQTLEVLKRFSNLDRAETADYDVNQALADCLLLLSQETGNRIVVQRNLGEVPKIRCHPSELNQLFMSLLKNAIQAIPDTGTIEIRTYSQEGYVHIDILDTGGGIPEERLKDLFVPKFSRDGSRVKLGLGLPTSHNIVQRHGGTIRVESRLGKGTHVFLTLPEKVGAAAFVAAESV